MMQFTTFGRALYARSALAICAALMFTAASPNSETYLETVMGEVEIGTGVPPIWRAAKNGDHLGPYDTVRTGPDGRVQVHLATGSLRLYPSSVLRLATDPGQQGSERVRLEQGTSLFDVLKRSGDDTFEVETHDAVLVVKGTRFSVAVEPDHSSMAVFRGLVGVRGIDRAIESEILVRPGFAAIGGGEVPMELVVNGSADPWEGWSQKMSAPGTLKPKTQPPARMAVDMAKAHALQTARPEIVEHAKQRRSVRMDSKPGSAKKTLPRTAGAQAETGQKNAGANGQAMDEMMGKSKGSLKKMALNVKQEQDSRLAEKLEHKFDAVQEAGSEGMEQIQEEFAESVVAGETGGGGGVNLEIEIVNSRVKIAGGSFDEIVSNGDLQSMLSTGTTTFSANLMQLLANQGTDPMQFAAMLQQMLGN